MNNNGHFSHLIKRAEAIRSHSVKGQFIVGSLRDNNTLSFSEAPVVHCSEYSARNEVIRLAKLNPGKQFAYLEVKGVARAADVIWSA